MFWDTIAVLAILFGIGGLLGGAYFLLRAVFAEEGVFGDFEVRLAGFLFLAGLIFCGAGALGVWWGLAELGIIGQ